VKKILSLILLLSSSAAIAETGYITDILKITLRSGESTTHKVIRMLPSGTRVTVLERNADTGYARIRLADGTTGYVLNRMILAERPARERLTEAEKQLDILRQEPGKLSSQLAKLQEEHSALQQDHAAMKSENRTLTEELQRLQKVAADPVRIAEERDDAVKRSQALSDELDITKLSNQRLTDKVEENTFLYGAGAVIAGIIIGLVLPLLRVRKSRSSEWGDF
jgi:SH3 domain protein